MPLKKRPLLSVYYADIPNMGDQLNALVIERCFGYDVMPASPLKADLSGIGSGLGLLGVKRGGKREAAFAQRKRPLYVWGTGFIRSGLDDVLPRTGVDYRVVRGELSRRRVEAALGRSLDIPTGDAGLLAPRLLDGPVEKRYRLGVIPHFRERDDGRIRRLAAITADSTVIDLCAPPLDVIRQIASCELIISSSLHGLIVADAFGIPNLHVRASGALIGDGFKFDDYYSGYGVAHDGVDLSDGGIDSVAIIGDRYRIPRELVEAKQRMLYETFPFRERVLVGSEPPEPMGRLAQAVRLMTPCGLLRRAVGRVQAVRFDVPAKARSEQGSSGRAFRWLVPFGFAAAKRARIFGETRADIVRGGALCRTLLWQKTSSDRVPKVSVVLPVYNVAQYLRRALESISAQTLKEIEIIAVDDGSTDGSGAILDDYAKTEPRLTVVHIPNGGAGAARNVGLERARGEYLFFCDPDDWCEPRMLRRLYDRAHKTDADVVVSGKTVVDADTGAVVKRAYPPDSWSRRREAIDPVSIADRIFKGSWSSPWNKLFRRGFAMEAGIRFQNTPRSNDVFFVYTSLARAKHVAYLKCADYCYRENRSGCLSLSKDKHPTASFDAYAAIEGSLREHGLWPTFRTGFLRVYLPWMISNLRQFRSEASWKLCYPRIRERFLAFRQEVDGTFSGIVPERAIRSVDLVCREADVTSARKALQKES